MNLKPIFIFSCDSKLKLIRVMDIISILFLFQSFSISDITEVLCKLNREKQIRDELMAEIKIN